MAESKNANERLDMLVEAYAKDECPKHVVKQVDFYRKIAENGTKRTFFWSVALPGAGHLTLRCWSEGFIFLFLELLLTGTILVLFVKSLIAVFTSDPHYWHALSWWLGTAIVFRAVSFVRVAILANRIKSDAAYLMLRLKDKKPPE